MTVLKNQKNSKTLKNHKMEELLESLEKCRAQESEEKNRIVTRLLEAGNITPAEATFLLREESMIFVAKELEISSGAQIIGGNKIKMVTKPEEKENHQQS